MTTSEPDNQLPHDVLTFGIDISGYSGKVDWEKLTAELNPNFVFARAFHVDKNRASSYADARFANEYWPALRELNIARGAYLYCHPKAEPDESINNFLSVYTPQIGDILPTLDVEDVYDNGCGVPVRNRIEQLERMVQLVAERIGGQKPMIYTKARVWNELGNPAQFSDCPLWVIDYHSPPPSPDLPVIWSRFTFWQYAPDQRAAAIQGYYDSNYFNGPKTNLSSYFVRELGRPQA